MPRVKRVTRATTRNAERRKHIWELHKAGLSTREIGAAIGISHTHVQRLMCKELAELEQFSKLSAQQHRLVELERSNLVVRESTRMIVDNCAVCTGSGTSERGRVCPQCEGTGRRHDETLRLRAMDRLLAAIRTRGKLLGLERNTVDLNIASSVSYDFREELAALSEEELDRMLAALLTE